MDKKFLDKVLDQIVSETRLDYDWEVIETPFSHFIPPNPQRFSDNFEFFIDYFFPSYHYPSSLNTPSSFLKHCEEVYGLNGQETKYVWEEYKRIIKDKIKNNGKNMYKLLKIK
mgnify:CR=1 FL=1